MKSIINYCTLEFETVPSPFTLLSNFFRSFSLISYFLDLFGPISGEKMAEKVILISEYIYVDL